MPGPLQGKAFQENVRARLEADQRYGLDSGGPAEEHYWREQDMERSHPAEIEAEDYEDFAA